MMFPGTCARRDSGMTLIELLVVIAIIGVLSTALVVGIPKMLTAGDEKAVESMIRNIESSLDAYEKKRQNGDYPPTSLDGYPGVGRLSDIENCGIEAVVICLNRKGTSCALEFDDLAILTLENYDGDSTRTALTNFAAKDLFELVDPWGNPLAYFHHRDYAVAETKGYGQISGVEGGTITARPWKNTKTKSFYRSTSFQLFSAGADGEFNTDDDITNFDKN